MHAPVTHVCPAWQVTPALRPVQYPFAPQNVMSVCGSMQVPLQMIWPVGHRGSQTPAWQAELGPQATAPVQSEAAPQ